MRNRHQQHRPNRSRRKRIQKCVRVYNSQLRKNPSTNYRSDQPNQNIPDTPKSPPARHLSRQPTRQQPNQQPTNQSPLPLHNHHPLLQHHHPKQKIHLHPSSVFWFFSAHSAFSALNSSLLLTPPPAPAASCNATFPIRAPNPG